ncbi:MAG: hypothetical protein M3Y33_05465, partial [Actinomycetota bacterium]|nr:hypothetical protein [Actinomycetota bacterium]
MAIGHQARHWTQEERLSSGFDAGEQRWRAGLGTLRQVVRQELVARQLAAHLPAAPPPSWTSGAGRARSCW